MIKTKRRTFLTGALGSATLGGLGLRPALAGGEPIRIGCLTTLSGVYASSGTAQSRGMQLAAEAINAGGGIGGRNVEIIVRDDSSKPDTAVASVRELAGNGVRIFAGGLSSGVALAVSGVMQELDSVFLNAASHGNNLTHQDFNKHYFRVTDYSAMRIGAAAWLMAQRYPEARKWGAVLPDAEIGVSAIATFKYRLPEAHKTLHNASVEIMAPIWVKFGATDYRNAIAGLMSQGIDGLFIGNSGGDEIAFLQQAGQMGLSKMVKAITNSGSELEVTQALKGRTPANYWSGAHWYSGCYPDNAVSTGLVRAYKAKGYGDQPDGYVGTGHTAVTAVAAAMKAGAALNSGELIEALQGLKFETVKGTMTIRAEDHQALCDVNYVNPVADGSAEGWSVKDFARVDGTELAGAPMPGKPLAFTPVPAVNVHFKQ